MLMVFHSSMKEVSAGSLDSFAISALYVIGSCSHNSVCCSSSDSDLCSVVWL